MEQMMFTGIIQGLGTIDRIAKRNKGFEFFIKPDFTLNDPEIGESIAVNGVCLTATTISTDFFSVDVSPESLSRSTLQYLKRGDRVNLERALRLSDRLGGHIVSGHVDCMGKVERIRTEGDFIIYTFSVPHRYDRYLVEKGSVAIDGISLTVNSCGTGTFSVSIIPHTAASTTLQFRKQGDWCNMEFDIIGKYVEKLLSGGSRHQIEDKSSLDKNFLASHGFI
jgi:riboflavin synthase